MKTVQFQDEAISNRLIDSQRSENELKHRPKNSDDIVAVLLSIYFNNYLSGIDRKFLNSLNTGNSTFFIIKNEEFIYPHKEGLFPYSIIESAVNQGGPAIFTQNYDRTIKRQNEKYKIVSTLLSNTENESLVIGMFGKGLPYRDFNDEESFINLANDFRIIEQDIHQTLSDLKLSFDCDEFRIIVNRQNSSIVAINSANRELEMSDFIGKSLEDLKDKLSSMFARRKISMENINTDYMELALIRLEDKQTEENEHFDIHGFTIEQIRPHVNNLILGSSYLESITKDKTQKHFLHLLMKEAEEIDKAISNDRLFNKETDNNLIEQNLLCEIEQAIAEVENNNNCKFDYTISPELENFTVTTMENRCHHLFELILKIHIGSCENLITTKISYGNGLEIASLFDRSKEVSMKDRSLLNYLKNYTRKTGIEFNHEINNNDKQILTTLKIKMDDQNEKR